MCFGFRDSQSTSSRSYKQPNHSYEECPECEEKFSDLKSLTQHFNAAHDSDENELNEKEANSSKKVDNNSFKQENPTIGECSKPMSSRTVKTKTVEATSEAMEKSKRNLAEQIKREVQRKIHENMKEQSLGMNKEKRAEQSFNSDSQLNKKNSTEAPTPSPAVSSKKRSREDSLEDCLKSPDTEPVRLVFYQDSQVERILDVGTAKLSSSSEEPFLNSFLAFFRKKDSSGAVDSVPTLTFVKGKGVRDSSSLDEEAEEQKRRSSASGEVSVVTLEDEEGDPLLEHIEASGLPLKLRRPTLNDGNCWYDAAADQVLLHNITDKPHQHEELRREVCQALRHLPQADTWRENFFSNSRKKFSLFIKRHSKSGTWTDNLGILCQATALYLGKAQHARNGN